MSGLSGCPESANARHLLRHRNESSSCVFQIMAVMIAFAPYLSVLTPFAFVSSFKIFNGSPSNFSFCPQVPCPPREMDNSLSATVASLKCH